MHSYPRLISQAITEAHVPSFIRCRFLDYHRRCHDPVTYPDTCTYYYHYNSQPADCCSATSFVHHLFTRGMTMLIVALIAVGVPIIVSIKHKSEMRVDGGGHPSTPGHLEDAPVEPRPLSSLGIHTSLGLESLYMQMETCLEFVAVHVSESLLVSLVCVPIGFYYFGYALLSRVMPRVFSTSGVTSDEWLLGLSVFFVLGRCADPQLILMHSADSPAPLAHYRESCKFDMMPSVKVNYCVTFIIEPDFSCPSCLQPHITLPRRSNSGSRPLRPFSATSCPPTSLT